MKGAGKCGGKAGYLARRFGGFRRPARRLTVVPTEPLVFIAHAVNQNPPAITSRNHTHINHENISYYMHRVGGVGWGGGDTRMPSCARSPHMPPD